jgi:hypothetical protein
MAALRASMHRAFAPPAAANDATPATVPAMSKNVARAVESARLHLRFNNPGAYARALAGEHRAANGRQQRAIEAVIAADETDHLFARHPANGCLMAREG